MLINILAVVSPILLVILYIVYKESGKDKVEQKKCGCNKSESGYCDGSHNDTKDVGGGI